MPSLISYRGQGSIGQARDFSVGFGMKQSSFFLGPPSDFAEAVGNSQSFTFCLDRFDRPAKLQGELLVRQPAKQLHFRFGPGTIENIEPIWDAKQTSHVLHGTDAASELPRNDFVMSRSQHRLLLLAPGFQKEEGILDVQFFP